MPIRPIDLQTLLMQMSQVGRDQAIEKDGPALQSGMQAAAAQKKEVEAKEALRRTEEPKDGPGAVKERQGRPRGGKGARQGADQAGEAGTEDEAAEEAKEEIVRDPSLGNRVDLTG